jgi:hypothetical protein
MSDRRERIPAAEVPDPKLWKLPFWTEPKHIVQAEVEAEEEDDSEVLIEEEEIEIEPITAEQLEARVRARLGRRPSERRKTGF